MELKFIWINSYRIVENLGINFHHSENLKFTYTNGILKLFPNNESSLDFGPNITGVTVIAGENGSGKSSLCEVVLLSTATYKNGAFGFNYIFKGIVCYGDHIFVHESLVLENIEELRQAKYVIQVFKESPFEEMRHEWRSTFVMGGFIYYSNFLDYRTDIDAVNLANISTLTALNKNFYFGTSYPKMSLFSEREDENRGKDRHAPLQIHNIVEGNRIVKFYITFPELVPFIDPDEILIKSTYPGNNKWLNFENVSAREGEEDQHYWKIRNFNHLQNEILNLVFDTSQQYDEETIVQVDVVKFKQAIKLLYKFNLLVALSIMKKEVPESNFSYQFIFTSPLEMAIADRQSVDLLFSLHDSIVEKSSIIDDKSFKPLSLERYFDSVEEWRFYMIEKYYLPNNPENRKLLLEFMLLEAQILRDENPFRRITNYNLPALSSGENSFLTFFARIYDVIERYNTGYDNKDKLILFIDEAEVGFHPAWQRIYFNKLLDFLNNYIKGYIFQLILTTHSPYLLSDLPAENVIRLKKGVDGKTTILNSNGYKTFGANIHELLGTSFFLEDGYIGQFAKERLEEFIAFLQNKNQKFDRESAKQFISLVGDEIIANRLTDMYNEKFDEALPADEKEYEQWLLTELQRIQLKDE